jgi:hypothetical protein
MQQRPALALKDRILQKNDGAASRISAHDPAWNSTVTQSGLPPQ